MLICGLVIAEILDNFQGLLLLLTLLPALVLALVPSRKFVAILGQDGFEVRTVPSEVIRVTAVKTPLKARIWTILRRSRSRRSGAIALIVAASSSQTLRFLVQRSNESIELLR